MTADETERLRRLLAALREYGFLLPASVEPALPGYGFGDVVADLRASVGAHIVDAALAARHQPMGGGDPPPAAVMQVWAFEPEAGNRGRSAEFGEAVGRRPVRRGAARRRRRRSRADAVRPDPVRPVGGGGGRRSAAVAGAAVGARRQLRRVRRVGPVLMAGHGRLATA